MHWQTILRNLMLFFSTFLIGLTSTYTVFAGGPEFELTVVNTRQTITCDKLQLDPGQFRCKKGEITYKYQVEAIEAVTYKGETIYPYDSSVQLTESDLYEKDCDYLVKTLRSPLILENNPDIFILVGIMYEKGICTRKNIQQAYKYYRKAGKPGMKKYTELRRRSG